LLATQGSSAKDAKSERPRAAGVLVVIKRGR
jgi:hypothetical protein